MTLAIGQSCKPGRQTHRRKQTCPPARWCILMVRQKETLGSRALVDKVIGYLHSRQHERDHGTCNHNRSPFRMIIDILRLGVGVSLVELGRISHQALPNKVFDFVGVCSVTQQTNMRRSSLSPCQPDALVTLPRQTPRGRPSWQRVVGGQAATKGDRKGDDHTDKQALTPIPSAAFVIVATNDNNRNNRNEQQRGVFVQEQEVQRGEAAEKRRCEVCNRQSTFDLSILSWRGGAGNSNV